jgi:hypothetical protein
VGNNSAEIRAWYDDYQNKLRAERAEAREEGRKEEGCYLLLRLLRARFGELPPDAVARVEVAERSEIERWGLRVLTAQSLADVFGEPG